MSLPPTHFLSLARQRFPTSPGGLPSFDISTVAAADYDVDVQSGFMPPGEPVRRLLGEFEIWEGILDRALGKLKLSSDPTADSEYTKRWRDDVRQMKCLAISPLVQDERKLRRAHVVLTYMMHLYIHSVEHDPAHPIIIPSSLAIPLVKVSRELGLAPILTYADTVLWNWVHIDHPASPKTRRPSPRDPLLDGRIKTHTSFSGTPDEDHFYLTSAKIELRGVEALSLMRSMLDETFLGDAIAKRRIEAYLSRLAHVIDDINALLAAVRNACDPTVFYNQVRPWFNGGTSHPAGWKYEGVDAGAAYANLAGPSAGQSSLVHAIDVFLGVNHAKPLSPSLDPGGDRTFLHRQLMYMPRHHRAFLSYLSTVENPVRALVLSDLHDRFPSSSTSSPASGTTSIEADVKELPPLSIAYNEAVGALRRFRDMHIRIATLYIVSQARGSTMGSSESGAKGTGGTLLVPFLKTARDNTTQTALSFSSDT